MPKPIPFPTRLKKEAPASIQHIPQDPVETPLNEKTPVASELTEGKPEATKLIEEIPVESKPMETIPDPIPEKETKPSDLNEENCVVIDGQKIEIKPTKLKYFRNKASSAYGYIKAIPLHELLTYGKGVLDQTRDADQLLYDFLVSVFDNSAFVRDHYDNLDADVIEQIIKIFGRINHIDEKEEVARKNREAQVKR